MLDDNTQSGRFNTWRWIARLFDWLTVIHTHVFMDFIAQYLKENIAGVPSMFMKMKMPVTFVALAKGV
jgi:ABC-type proline/glycine betaine transport system permease subunit